MPRDYASLTHLHLRNLLAAYLPRDAGALRILDLGSGSGTLTTYLQRQLSEAGFTVELYGLDVNDMQVQERSFHTASIARAHAVEPGHPWQDRLVLIESGQPWPFPTDHFDAIVSNQVFEHIHEPDATLAQISRTLKPSGYSAHLFPFESYILEGHLKVPFAHWLTDGTLREQWIKRYYGLQDRRRRGKYFRDGRAAGWSLADYSAAHADYLVTQTHYMSFREFARASAQHGLRVDLDHTVDFYALKAHELLKRPVPRQYASGASPMRTLAGHALKIAGGVSVGIRHADRYGAWRERTGSEGH